MVDDPDAAITYEPSFLFVEGRPGETIEHDVLVKNQTLVDAAFVVAINDMRAGPGADTAFDYVDVGDAPRGAGEWIAIVGQEFSIKAGEERRVELRIAIPDDAGAGGHFAALLFTASATEPTGQFDIGYVSPVPVFVTVAGDIERELRVDVTPDDAWRWSGGRAEWTVELHNAGDVHENVSGRVRLDSMLSGTSSAQLKPAILLPGERRTQRVAFTLRSAPDAYVADARIDRDDGEPARATARRVIVLPWWLAIVGATVVGITWWRVRSRAGARAHGEFEDDIDGFDPAG